MASRQDNARPAQAIVVFGTAQFNGEPSPVLKARLGHAIDLYRRKLAPVVVATLGLGVGAVAAAPVEPKPAAAKRANLKAE